MLVLARDGASISRAPAAYTGPRRLLAGAAATSPRQVPWRKRKGGVEFKGGNALLINTQEDEEPAFACRIGNCTCSRNCACRMDGSTNIRPGASLPNQVLCRRYVSLPVVERRRMWRDRICITWLHAITGPGWDVICKGGNDHLVPGEYVATTIVYRNQGPSAFDPRGGSTFFLAAYRYRRFIVAFPGLRVSDISTIYSEQASLRLRTRP